MDGSAWISLISLIASGGTAVYTYRFSRTQQRLNEMLIKEKQAEQEDAKRAVFQVEIEGAAPQYSLSIENVGAAPAVDVFFTSEGPDNEFAKGMGAVSPSLTFLMPLSSREKSWLMPTFASSSIRTSHPSL
ncbi:hypothetical protein [Variovorax sp. LjRoot178]|uniref:hypothetical protein n=1 Tax=Variovorax sp. LjRoot178 TaxID=3342277 RepID=UPI003ECD352B